MKSKPNFHILHLDLSDQHLKKLADGKGILLNGGMIGEGGHPIHLSTKQKNAILRKTSKGKKHTLKFDPDEYHQNIELQEGGALWKHVGKFFKNAGRKIGEFYKEHLKDSVGPSIKNIVKTATEKVVPLALSGLTSTISPEFTPLVAPLYQKIGEKAGESLTKKIGKSTGLYETGSGIMVPINHTSQKPPPSVKDLTGHGLFLSSSSGNGLYLKSGAGFRVRKHPDPRMNPLIR